MKSMKTIYTSVQAPSKKEFDRQCNDLSKQGFEPIFAASIIVLEGVSYYFQNWRKFVWENELDDDQIPDTEPKRRTPHWWIVERIVRRVFIVLIVIFAIATIIKAIWL